VAVLKRASLTFGRRVKWRHSEMTSKTDSQLVKAPSNGLFKAIGKST
jgi:hypothetical protein